MDDDENITILDIQAWLGDMDYGQLHDLMKDILIGDYTIEEFRKDVIDYSRGTQ